VAGSGDDRADRDLLSLVEDARSSTQCCTIRSRYNRVVIAPAIAGVEPEDHQRHRYGQLGSRVHRHAAGRLAEEVERGWSGQFIEGQGFQFERTVRGVKDVAIIDDAFLGSADARKLDEYATKLQDVYVRAGKLRRKDTEQAIHGPVGLFEAVTDAARKGVTLQRYKGLG
jgi:DNA gyrase subunit B